MKKQVAIVHDWLLGMRGGERVLEALLRLYPNADIYTLFYDPHRICSAINLRAVIPTWLNRIPSSRKYYRFLLPVFPRVIETIQWSKRYDLVLSTSHCVAHGVIPPDGATHATYCFSPMRYIYDQADAYAAGGSRLQALALRGLAPRLREWDARAARRCGNYGSISNFVAARVKAAYGLGSRVIYPPVRTDFFTPGDSFRPDDAAWLVASALVPYKRVDTAIAAANALGAPLIVAGSGPEEARLRRLAGPTVRFTGWLGDSALRDLYRSCRALIFPGEEDFGIVPVEAMACGMPVLALRAGGLLETVAEGVSGDYFGPGGAEELAEAMTRFDSRAFDSREVRRRAEEFSESVFLQKFSAWIDAMTQ